MTLELKEPQTDLKPGQWYEGKIDGEERLLRITSHELGGTKAILSLPDHSLVGFATCELASRSQVEIIQLVS